MGIDDSGTIDEEDFLHQSDVLPDFGLARNWRYVAHFFLSQRVYNRALASVRIADEADADLFSVFVKFAELSQELNESAFAERVSQAGVEC